MGTLLERRQRVWEFMKRGVSVATIATILETSCHTVAMDVRYHNKRMLDIGLKIGDWVEVKNVGVGQITLIILSGAKVAVDVMFIAPPTELMFSIDEIRKINEMEILALVAR